MAHFRNGLLEMAMMELQMTKCGNDCLGQPLSLHAGGWTGSDGTGSF